MTIELISSGEQYLILIAVLLALPFVLSLCWQQPASITLGFIALICLFSSSTWGQLQEENTLYARGTGMFYFSLINLLLWITVAAAAMRQLVIGTPSKSSSPFQVFLVAFSFLLFAHVVLGLMADKELTLILGYNGLINILNLLLFSWLIITTITTQEDHQSLIKLLLGLSLVRAAFGLIRYYWFDGDNANPYRNFESLDIKLVFFDIGDNYVAALAAFCLGWLLLSKPSLKIWQHLALSSFLAAEVATVALSFRRSSLIGLGLMMVVLVLHMPWRRRLWFLATSSLALITAGTTLMRERLQFNVNSPDTDFLSSLLYDVGPDHATQANRFYELEAAAHSLNGNWLFGLGSWGSFYGDEDILDYHFGKFDFVHSGFGHIILKSGLVGLSLFLGLLITFTIHYFQRRKHLQGYRALFADAGLAGLLFWMPTLLIGTPIIEFRSMLLIGMTLALPYLHTMRASTVSPRYYSYHVAT
jgi:hypothetical protein